MGLNLHIGLLVCLHMAITTLFVGELKGSENNSNWALPVSPYNEIFSLFYCIPCLLVLCFTYFPQKCGRWGGGLVADRLHEHRGLSSQQHLEVSTKTGAHNRYAGNGHKIYLVMMRENCKLDHQMVV